MAITKLSIRDVLTGRRVTSVASRRDNPRMVGELRAVIAHPKGTRRDEYTHQIQTVVHLPEFEPGDVQFGGAGREEW